MITEQLQIISHSRGSAFASGYMQSVSAEIRNLANKDNMTFLMVMIKLWNIQ